MGLADLGAVLSCNRDGAFREGYDPRLKLQRTQTLMGGADALRFKLSVGGRALSGHCRIGPQKWSHRSNTRGTSP